MKTTHLLLILFVAFAINTACAQGKEKYVFTSDEYSNKIEPEKGLRFREEKYMTSIGTRHGYFNFSDYIWFKNEENLKKCLQVFEKTVRMAYNKGNFDDAIRVDIFADAEGKITKFNVSTDKCLGITEKELFAFKDQLLQERELRLEFIQDIEGMNEAEKLITQFTFGIEELIDLYDGASIKEVRKKQKEGYYREKFRERALKKARERRMKKNIR